MATSRLKRKVEQRAEDGSTQGGFGNLLESFVSLGTPLPSLASKADVGEFKPIWEQEVVDEKGRYAQVPSRVAGREQADDPPDGGFMERSPGDSVQGTSTPWAQKKVRLLLLPESHDRS